MAKKLKTKAKTKKIIKSKKKKLIIYLFLLLTIIVLGLTAFFVYKIHSSNIKDSSITGEEIKEIKQNTIPSDVKKKIVNTNNFSIAPSNISENLHVPILLYHYIEYVKDPKDTVRIALNTNPLILEEQIKTLQEAGYNFITVSELTDAFDGKFSLPPKPIVLTFDDGYRDFYTFAYPILKKYNVKATQYVISGFLDYPNHLLISQVQEIAKDGLVEIGAHTIHHIWLKGRPITTINNEVLQSKLILEKLINKPVNTFSYPFGAFDSNSIGSVINSGFKSAVSTIPGIDQLQTNRYFLYRLRPGGRTGQYLLNWLSSVKNN